METPIISTQPNGASAERESNERKEELLPQGIHDLVGINSLSIHQHLDYASVCFQLPCRYSISGRKGDVDEPLLYVQEVSECYVRQCLGAIRGFVMKFSNQLQQDVIRLERPLRCPCGICWWWCCCVQDLTIESPPGHVIGKIAEDRLCVPSYAITDENDDLAFKVIMPCCMCKLCSDVCLEICDARYDHSVIAEIRKSSKGNSKDCCGSQNDFTIDYVKPDLNVQDKILILGASFLIDFNYFEGQQRSCC